MKRRILACAAALAMVMLQVTSVFAAIDIPDSSEYYVNDYMNVLSLSTKEMINEKNAQLDQGAEIVVLTTDYINTDTEEFAYQVFNQWKIGDSKKNNGVLIVLVVSEGKFWITPGTGVEDILSPSVLSDLIYDYLEEDFDRGNYDQAVKNTFNEIYKILASRYGTVAVSNTNQGGMGMKLSDIMMVIFVAVILIAVLALAIALPKGRYHRTYRPRYRGYERRRYENPYSRGPVFGPRPSRGPTVTTRSRSRSNSFGSGSSGRSFSSGSPSGKRSSGGGKSRGGGAGRK